MKIKVEYNATPFPVYNPTDNKYQEKCDIAHAKVTSPLWKKATKDYGYMINVVNNTATIVKSNGVLITVSPDLVRVIDEEYIETNLTK